MKKAVLVILVLTFIFISCDNEDMNKEVNPFVGTWEKISDQNVHFVYTETIATGYVYGLGYKDNISWTGTYTYDDTEIKVVLDQEYSTESMILSWPNGYIAEYEFKDALLYFYEPLYSSFKKITD